MLGRVSVLLLDQKISKKIKEVKRKRRGRERDPKMPF
jgi:hypothetical protein